jgi:hypothetical protein
LARLHVLVLGVGGLASVGAHERLRHLRRALADPCAELGQVLVACIQGGLVALLVHVGGCGTLSGGLGH